MDTSLFPLVTKQKFHNRPTDVMLCACLEHMRTHAEGNGFHQISMSCTDYRLDNLEGNVVRQIIQDTLKTSPAFTLCT